MIADDPQHGTVPSLTCPAMLAVRVVCATHPSHPVGGLFVVFRPKPPAGEARKLHHPSHGAEASRSRPMVLGIAGQDGWLRPVHTINPWHDFYTWSDPHLHKLSPIQKYEGCLVRHADPEIVRAFAAYLDTGEDVAEFEKSWGNRNSLIEELDIALDTSDGDQLVLRVPEVAGGYVPQGTRRYNGWTLFRGMPHARCPDVVNAVMQLQEDLGLLRFPIGAQDSPYVSVSRSEQKPSSDQNLGIFDGKVQAAVARFQEHARQGQTFELSKVAKEEAVRRNVYAFVLGGPCSYEPNPALAFATLGHVDRATAEEIESWCNLGRRKPGKILLPLFREIGPIWMLEQAAVACDAWSHLLIAFGSYGLKSGHSFRNVLDKGSGNGKRLNSIHKTGLAIDFSGGATARAVPAFPIRFEAHWTRNDRVRSTTQQALDRATTNERAAHDKRDRAKSPAAIAQADKTLAAARRRLEDARKAREAAEQAVNDDELGAKQYWNIRWRLYSHSSLDVFGDSPDKAFGTLRKDLAAYPEKLIRHLRQQFGVLGQTAEAKAWIESATAPARELAQRLAKLGNEKLRAQFFRDEVWQWIYNHYEPDGGSRSATSWPPDRSDHDFPPASFSDPKSYVNLTALGAHLRMARIGGTRVKDGSIRKAGQVAMAQFPLAKAAATVAQLLVYLKTLPDQRHANDDITVFRSKEKLVAYKPADIDAALMKSWLETLESQVQNKKGPTVAGLSAFDLWITLAVTKSGEDKLAPVLAVLDEKPFADKLFAIVAAGTHIGIAPATMFDGASLRAALDDALRRFKDTARQQPPSKAKGTQAIRDRKPIESTKKDVADWRVTIRPIFIDVITTEGLPFAPGDEVRLPAPRSANLADLWRPLEWWHYQHEGAAGVSWGDLLEECGFSAAVLAGDDPPREQPSIVPLGVGYHESNFADKSGDILAGVVENDDESPENLPIGG